VKIVEIFSNRWTYNTSSDLNGTAYTGTYASYSGAGSIQVLLGEYRWGAFLELPAMFVKSIVFHPYLVHDTIKILKDKAVPLPD
jgi:hypothetical protein